MLPTTSCVTLPDSIGESQKMHTRSTCSSFPSMVAAVMDHDLGNARILPGKQSCAGNCFGLTVLAVEFLWGYLVLYRCG